ncbi:MAG: UPF0182 family protein [Terriglobia bacterium]
MNRQRIVRVIVGVFVFLLIFGPLFSNGVDLLVDWLWFNQEHFRILYTTVLKSQIFLSGLAGLGFMVIVGANLLLVRRLVRHRGFQVYEAAIEVPGLERLGAILGWLVWAGVLLVGFFTGEWAQTHWMEYLLAQHPVVMGQTDPLFGIDLSFYLFRLPFVWFLYHFVMLALIACLLSALFLYFIEGGVWVTQRGPAISRQARIHLLVLGALIFVAIAYRFRLSMYDLLYSPTGQVYGAGYTDVAATLPVLWILLVLSLLAALALVAAGLRSGRGSLRPALWSVGLLVLVGVIGGGIYPAIIQSYIVVPNELDKERPYIARAIEFTRKAYALDRFEERNFSAVEDLTLNAVRSNDATMRNVRLWDHNPLKTTFGQLQEIRSYYDFLRVDNDRYLINGSYRQVSLSPRELTASSLPNRSWINEHLTYTHGYGLCMSPVNEITPDGLPVFFIKDIPPVSSIPIPPSAARITRPEIYYGEQANDYCFVDTNTKEFDYPSGSQDVYTTYQGTGGITVGNVLRRLLFTLKFGELNVLLSSDIRPESRLMIYRQVIDRASRLAPFLRFDTDPYLVITQDGAMVWILDAYTTSARYPYSEPTGDLGNYIRNSVKVTVNAYDGRVHFYISDPTDALIQAYARLFPGVFEPLEAMPEDLRSHIRYPIDFFSIQAAKYAAYHMTDPGVFYNKEDLWRVAQSAGASSNSGQAMPPYYTIMKLAEVGTREEFILMVPFTPPRKDNMIAWMAARCDAPNYGKVLVFAFPKQKLIYGPQQIESRIDQDPTISQQLTLWGQGGSKVIRGTLLVIPVNNSVLYLEPLYLSAEAGGALPQLKRVIVAYSDNVVMEATLDAALSRIFGGAVTSSAPSGSASTAAATAGQSPSAPSAPPGAADLQALAHLANQHYERAQQLLRQGDWAGYGEEIKQLGEVIKRMAQAQPPK